MHQPTHTRARLAALAVAGTLAIGGIGASMAQPTHAATPATATTTRNTNTHAIAANARMLAAPLADEGGPPPGH